MRNNSSIKGFTLIELTIVLIVISLLVAAASSLTVVQLKRKQVTDTKERLVDIQDALAQYVAQRNDLPCPAGLTDQTGAAGYGQDGARAPVFDNDKASPTFGLALDVDCSTLADGSNVFSDNGVLIGTVPVFTLGLDGDHMYDGYGRRFVYAVAQAVASDEPGQLQPLAGNGAITVNDVNNNPVMQFALYSVVSHGEDGIGGYTRAGLLYGGEACGPTAGAAEENCDNDAVFVRVQDQERSTAGGSNRLDDYFASASSFLENATVNNILVCNEKGMIFSPTAVRAPDPNATADEDGCINPTRAAEVPPILADFACPTGEVLVRFANGVPDCDPVPTAPTTPTTPTAPPGSCANIHFVHGAACGGTGNPPCLSGQCAGCEFRCQGGNFIADGACTFVFPKC